MNKKSLRNMVLYTIIALLFILLTVVAFNQAAPKNGQEISYSDFLRQVKAHNVSAVKYARGEAQIYGLNAVSEFDEDKLPGNYDFFVYVQEDTLRHDLTAIASVENNAPFEQIDSSLYHIDSFSYAKLSSFNPLSLLPSIILFALVGVSFYWLMRQQGGGGAMNTFAKSKARVSSSDNKVTFDDVAGADEEKAELAEVVEFLKNPKRFSELGARIPKGVLLMGPPGTGKTLLAKAVAGEAGAPFYSISGSDFVEMYVGVGASRVRDLFTTAKKTAPAIIFIDEIDAVGRQRGAGLGGGHDEREQTLNQLLVEMDGFDPHAGIIVIAATNRSDILDPALLRPGRFDRQVVVNRPDIKGREEILRVHAKNKPLGTDVDLKVLAQRTPGFTGADLENVLNEAAILTARASKKEIGMEEVEEAITRVIAGPEKKSRVVTPEDQRLTAYHETGHAVVARMLPGCDKVHEVSIIQRGMAGGYTMTLPETETQYESKSALKDQLAMMLGGRTAEELFLGDISTGASNDIQRATNIAHKMVTQWGMSDKLGPIYLGSNDEEVFLGRDIGRRQNLSEKVAAVVDAEVDELLSHAHDLAREILSTHTDIIEMVVEVLLKYERISGRQFEDVCLLAEGKLSGTLEEILKRTDPAADKADKAAQAAGETLTDGPDNAQFEEPQDDNSDSVQ